ncbi:uroplakin-3b-like isoform X1 [Paroedura picta]|uniref:uroplakin-3b-like isoform X1 n=1 Tax=Paroedura picta TaxID=143630 RepID=UPI0040567800
MDFILLLLLLLASVGTFAQIEVIPYVPQVTDQEFKGKITASTFALAPPNCIFNSLVNTTDEIWLVVTFANATSSFKNPTDPQEIPLYENLRSTLAYMTMKSTVSQYPCDKAKSGSVLRVGNESTCKSDGGLTPCNGLLPSPGPYRVKFLAMDSKGTKAETRWSGPITLKKAQTWQAVDTWPGRRSGDMIVITVILSVLCGVVTLGFLSTVCYECFKLWRNSPPETVEQRHQDPFQTSHYDTHHIPPTPPVRPPAPVDITTSS